MKHVRVTAKPNASALSAVAVIAGSLSGTLAARAADVPFTERVISTIAINANSVFATDLDGDGDIDVLSASSGANSIAWYENDGGSPPTFTERGIPTSASIGYSVFATDLDGDGDTDVLSAFGPDDIIAWYESDGASPPIFTERVISTTADLVVSVFAKDVDGDGDIDVLSASWSDSKIAWYENDGVSPPNFTERVITTAADIAWSVFATDLDGDGDTDVLSAFGNIAKIGWYENGGGSSPTFTERVVAFAGAGVQSVFAIDLDGDGDIDVLSASRLRNEIAWYENDGGLPPNFFLRPRISTSASGAHSVFAADVDGDGDTDVLSASPLDDKIAWYESDGGSPPTFIERVISITADGAFSVFATDLDGDGDIDVLSASRENGKIAWYENTPLPVPPAAGQNTYDRAIEIVLPASSAGTNTAYRVTLVTLYAPSDPQPQNQPNYIATVGELRYLNLLRDHNGNVVTNCDSSLVFQTMYPCISVGCNPEFADWGALFGGVTAYLSGNAIIPDSAYTIAQLDSSCVGIAATCTATSAATAFTTSRFGNTNAGTGPGLDLLVNVTDVVNTVEAIKPGGSVVPWEYQTYVRAQCPAPQNDRVNVTDIVLHVDAVKLVAYQLPIDCLCP